jgi:phosphatidylserine/phosphatidylglycerophosphate/cardiolipin synthase-like enzyme
MELLVQPEDGVHPVLMAIRKAKRTIDVHVFRLGYRAVEKALAEAVQRGVAVRALIAHTNKGGEKALRKLEQRLLEIGVTVSRTADDLVRYHGKVMIVDRSTLYVLGFNFVRRDIEHSRSLGIVTRKPELVRSALRLFEADFDRRPYAGGSANFLVSPVNARARLAAFLRGARRELLVYDAGLSDNAMIRLLQRRIAKGVAVKVIGKVEAGHDGLTAEPLPGERQHLRAIVRDREAAFVGSQSLRKLELDARREIGVIVRNPRVVGQIVEIFERDWAETDSGRRELRKAKKKARKARKGKARRRRGSESTPAAGPRPERPAA